MTEGGGWIEGGCDVQQGRVDGGSVRGGCCCWWVLLLVGVVVAFVGIVFF